MALCIICGCDTGSRKRSHVTPDVCLEALDAAIKSHRAAADLRIRILEDWRQKVLRMRDGDRVVVTETKDGITREVEPS